MAKVYSITDFSIAPWHITITDGELSDTEFALTDEGLLAARKALLDRNISIMEAIVEYYGMCVDQSWWKRLIGITPPLPVVLTKYHGHGIRYGEYHTVTWDTLDGDVAYE